MAIYGQSMSCLSVLILGIKGLLQKPQQACHGPQITRKVHGKSLKFVSHLN